MDKSLLINKEDLKYNINVIKENAKNTQTKIMAVVKGNGYGLGLVEYSNFLIDNGIDMLAVSTAEDAVKLRDAGIKNDILMMSSTCLEDDIKVLIENNIILTVGSIDSLFNVNKIARELNVIANVHIKIDTGFGRYGFIYSEIKEIVSHIKEATNVHIAGIFSHFSQSYAKSKKWTRMQYDRFIIAVNTLQNNGIETGMKHICNSSAFLRFPEMHLNAVRIGSAFLGRLIINNKYGLRKIGYLKTQISEIKMLPEGFNVGYSNTCTTKRKVVTAVIPVGYFEGFNVKNSPDVFRIIDKFRYLYNDFKSLFADKEMKITIGEKKYKVMGKIGMYHVIIDITDSPNIKVNDDIFLDVNPLYVDSSIRREYI